MAMLNIRHPIFLPLWPRVLVTTLTGSWALLELVMGNTLWALLFGVIALYCAYEFFVAFDPANYEDRDD
ncbi:hypothetical protein [Oricola cellulosilytica]|uniref:DUF3329 domain-containing protein n=1 Tax=Oricola cellulosilytica TaxID=1429082 RepID=A0A4R0PK62_9HYPH|nr:hypothetical protein [Oricola cellulosilytica]TCD16700.1 hypothetical protein E0D97_04630 [Oricola cellulosilytica]